MDSSSNNSRSKNCIQILGSDRKNNLLMFFSTHGLIINCHQSISLCLSAPFQLRFNPSAHIIQPEITMRSGFVELVVKNRLAGKSIPLATEHKKYEPVDSFKKYLTSVLPKIEETVEVELLKKNLLKIQSPMIRKQLVTAYLRRLYRLRFYEQDEVKSYKVLPDVKPEDIITFTDPTILKNVNEHSYYDVASYVLFSDQQFRTVFKNKCFGIYEKQYERTGKFSIMIRKESIGIANVMKALQEGKKTDWKALHSLSPEERFQYMNNENHYPVLFEELTNYIMEKVRPLKAEEKYMRIWGNSVICDTLVNSILQSIDQIDNVFDMADQAIEKVNNMDIDPSANDFTKRFKQLDTTPPLKIYKGVPYFASFNYTTPSFKSVFMGGLGGTGKSMILAYAAMLAYKNNWIVISTPNIMKWTQDLNVTPSKMFNGLFVIEEHVLEWLDQFKTTNQHILKDMVVNKQIYGKMDLTGCHVEEYEPVPNIYYKDRQTYFNDINKIYEDRVQIEFDTRHKWRMTDVLPEPKTVLDILEAGIKNPAYSTCAMGEMLHQIYESDRLILEVVDDFSWLYRRTVYRNYKYYNDSHLFGAIPPYHLAHCRFFVNLDGNKIKRGLKVVASSIGHLYKHHFDIKKIMLPVEYEHRVPNLTPQEFESAARYHILKTLWQADEVQRKNPMYMYTLSQGNWVDFYKAAELGHYY